MAEYTKHWCRRKTSRFVHVSIVILMVTVFGTSVRWSTFKKTCFIKLTWFHQFKICVVYNLLKIETFIFFFKKDSHVIENNVVIWIWPFFLTLMSYIFSLCILTDVVATERKLDTSTKCQLHILNFGC